MRAVPLYGPRHSGFSSCNAGPSPLRPTLGSQYSGPTALRPGIELRANIQSTSRKCYLTPESSGMYSKKYPLLGILRSIHLWEVPFALMLSPGWPTPERRPPIVWPWPCIDSFPALEYDRP